MTNSEKLRALSDYELADIVRFWLECDYCPINDGECQGNCYLAAMEWLKQEVSEDATD